MSKNIIICADGTGNRGGVGRGTNVWRLYNALDLNSQQPRQVAKYHDGVGTKKTLLVKLAGAAFGWGLTENVRCLYRYVALNYNPGDQVYLFGFSRGAYTVRVLHNILHYLGVPSTPQDFTPRALDDHIKWVVDEYKQSCSRAFKDKQNVRDALSREFEALREVAFIGDHHQHVRDITVGVWDTVNAVGAPANWIRRLICEPWTYDEVVESLPGKSTHARQALAIDDERSTFNPLFWPQGHSESANDRIIQAWFSGMHSNVGGGYPKDGLAHISLNWMIGEMGRICAKKQQAPLQFLSQSLSEIRCKANAHDKMYDSRAALAVYYRYSPRKILTVVNRGNPNYYNWLQTGDIPMSGNGANEHADVSTNPSASEIDYLHEQENLTLPLIHCSAIDRLLAHTDSYLPITIPAKFNVWSDAPNNQSQEIDPNEDGALIHDEPRIEKIELNLTAQGKHNHKDLKYWFAQIESQKSRRAFIWALFAALSSYLFFAPIFSNATQVKNELVCKFVQNTDCANLQSSEVGEAGNPFSWFIPDIATPWVNWITQHHPISTFILLLMMLLYFWNRHYKSRLRASGYFFWKHLPDEVSKVSAQEVTDSMLMKTQSTDESTHSQTRKPELLNKISVPAGVSKRFERITEIVSSSGSAQLRKLSKTAKKINGTDY